LNENNQRKLFDYLLKSKFEGFVGVPDSTMKYFIDQGLKQKKILITTREDESIGIAVGMSLANSLSVVFMQNAGFANSISTITSLVQLYKIPLLFVIGWRGYLKNDAPEHTKIGEIQSKLLKIIDLQSKILTDRNWKECARWAISQLKQNISCVLICKKDFNE